MDESSSDSTLLLSSIEDDWVERPASPLNEADFASFISFRRSVIESDSLTESEGDCSKEADSSSKSSSPPSIGTSTSSSSFGSSNKTFSSSMIILFLI